MVHFRAWAVFFITSFWNVSWAWTNIPFMYPSAASPATVSGTSCSRFRRHETIMGMLQHPDALQDNVKEYQSEQVATDRRSWLLQSASVATAAWTMWMVPSQDAFAETLSTASAQITDKIYLDIKGLTSNSQDASSATSTTKRIVIGLFGKEAPQSTRMLKQLVSMKEGGLPAPCKPKAERTLQKEQLEANKVYNSCVEGQDKGVNYEYAQIWRIVPNERIDVGAVSGKFIAREYPNWQEERDSGLRHDSPGVVSVRRGNDSGFGFTIYYPGSGVSPAAQQVLNEEHIVVGKVMEESMELLAQLNAVPVITSSKVNYMGLTGGPTTKSAPTRACQYGGPMYCNEYKPLIKLSIMNSGVL